MRQSVPGTYRTNRAFTFVEIMVVMVLAVGVVSIIFTFNVLTRRTEAQDNVDLVLQQRARIAMEYIVRDLRAAKKFDEVHQDKLIFEKFSRTADIYMQLGNSEPVRYTLKQRDDGDDVLIRFENNRNQTLLKFDEIDPNLFSAFYKDEATGSLEEFAYKDNPSDQREKISLLRVHIGVQQARKKLDLYSDVTIRYIWAKNQQPNWNPVRR